jgi:hypothetical protein
MIRIKLMESIRLPMPKPEKTFNTAVEVMCRWGDSYVERVYRDRAKVLFAR